MESVIGVQNLEKAVAFPFALKSLGNPVSFSYFLRERWIVV